MNNKARELAELIGIFSVVASLLFVGFQLMLEQRVSMGSQFHARTSLGHDALLSHLENPDWISYQAKLWENGFKPPWWNENIDAYQAERSLSMEEMVMRSMDIRLSYYRINNNYFQFRQGLISGEAWNHIAAQLEMDLQRPFPRAVALGVQSYEFEFIELLQKLANNTGTEH